MRYLNDWIYKRKILDVFNILNKSNFNLKLYKEYGERYLTISNFDRTIFTIKTRVNSNSLYKKAFEYFIKWLCKDNLIDIKR